MGLMTTVFVSVIEFIAAVLFAIIGRQGSDEFKAWTPRLTSRILELAFSKLPEGKRARMREEWAGRIEDMPGEVGKWVEAFRHLFAAWSISGSRPVGRVTETAEPITTRNQVLFVQTHADVDHVTPKSLRDNGIDFAFTTNHQTIFVQAKEYDACGVIRLPHHGRK